jgi:hypothetical protein
MLFFIVGLFPVLNDFVILNSFGKKNLVLIFLHSGMKENQN